MKRAFSKLRLAQSAALILASLVLAPVAQAYAGGGRAQAAGGGGGGARAQAASAGGTRQTAQVNNSRADVRTNNVRNTSVNNVNNVNVQKNVNVNVQGNSGWDNAYHPVATAAAVGATVAVTSAIVGSMVRTVPAGCVPVNYGGVVYQQCGTTWYQPQAGQYMVVNPPY